MDSASKSNTTFDQGTDLASRSREVGTDHGTSLSQCRILCRKGLAGSRPNARPGHTRMSHGWETQPDTAPAFRTPPEGDLDWGHVGSRPPGAASPPGTFSCHGMGT